MKKLVAFLLVFILVFSFFGCGENESSENSESVGEGDVGETIVFKIASIEPIESVTGTVMTEFEQYVEEETAGRVDVQLYSDGILGGEREIIEGVLLGTIQMALPSTTLFTTYGEKFGIFEVPFLFPTYESNINAWDGELGEIYNSWLEEEGFISYGLAGAGFRGFSNNQKEVRTPQDMKGMKVRVMESPVYVDSFNALGANSVAMSYNEIYTGLQQGTIDAQDNPPQFTLLSKFYEVQKYYTRLDHVLCNYIYICQKNYMESLPEDIRTVIETGLAEALPKHRQGSVDMDDDYIREMEAAGVSVTYLTDEERLLFVEGVRPIHDAFRQVVGDEIFDLALSYSK